MSQKTLIGSVVVALVIVAIIAFVYTDQLAPTPSPGDSVSNGEELGGSGLVWEAAPVAKFGLGYGPENLITNWKELSAGAQVDEVVWQNKLGRTVYVDLTRITTDGTASSTYRVYAFATTTSAVPASHDFTALVPGYQGMISGTTIATSSAATSTNSVQAAVLGKGVGVVPVAAGEYFIGFLQAADNPGCSDTACETATSTARGFNWKMLFRYQYKP